jgi:hypothetical protein
MFCGRCCVTGARSRPAGRLDIFIEIPQWDFHEKAHPVKGQRGGLRQLGQRSTLRATFPSALFSSLSRRLGARWDPSGAALLFEVRPLAQSADHTPSRSRRDEA